MIRDLLRHAFSRSNGSYPLFSENQRVLPEDYSGLVITSDIDRTYLASSISSLRGLVRTALEPAHYKRTFTGMSALYRGLRYGPKETSQRTPLYFISASPPQMARVLREKMGIDGIEVDGLTFKDQLGLVRRARVRELKKHVIYKLTALLLNRASRPTGAAIQEVLIGDDSETDAEAYLLYAGILNGSISPEDLAYALQGEGVHRKEKGPILALAERQDKSEVVKIYIHCTTRRDPASLMTTGPNLIAARDSLQIALDALHEGWIQPKYAQRIARELGTEEVETSLQDLLEREILPATFLQAFRDELL